MAHQIRYLIVHKPQEKGGTTGCFSFMEHTQSICSWEEVRHNETALSLNRRQCLSLTSAT